ncbi:hypothetical protein P167DRAFT_533048 [Morchella conica CCBAS932]|uniref:Uncharacterized protein n=1 Tax=Morchella conica CCBAS932 TaxID=1392247 RepID=A0A3N4L1S9_9PEZI|nr:hypothetical protein P167DRAFT_533048 [Morchella conica CCBAS932]
MSGGSCVIQYYNYPGVGIRNRQYLNYSQACRVGDNIECAGQGSWNPLNGSTDAQIDQAFENVDLALRRAGGKGVVPGLQDPQLPRRHGRCVLGGRDQELAEVVSGAWAAVDGARRGEAGGGGDGRGD